MADKDLLFHNGHRERLREKLLDDKLTSYEKLELLLTYAIPRRDVRPLARRLIQKFLSVYHIFTAPMEDLLSVPGVGKSTALLIKLVHELMLVSYRERLADGVILEDPFVIQEYCRQLLIGQKTEEVHVLYLGPHKRLIHSEQHSHGDFTKSGIIPGAIGRTAVHNHAVSVIIVHNHPLSDNDFSQDDIEATTMVEQVLKPLGIELYDHYLVKSIGSVVSLRETVWMHKSLFNK